MNIKNYPSGIKKTYKNNVSYANRGMNLEDDLNLTNSYYLENDIAIIYKKPIPITINQVDYPSRKEAVIKKAYFKTPSTTDYNGIYKGKYIDFEAKETRSNTSFPLKNIHAHQVKHMIRIKNHGGIAFIIVKFVSINKTYLLYINDFIDYINLNNKKSIPIDFFEKKGYLIKEGFNPRLDYIKIIDKKEFGDNNEKPN